MNDFTIRRSHSFAGLLTAGLFLWLAPGRICLAFELMLPDVGTDVNYDFFAETPQFAIAENALAQEVIQSQIMFGGGKHLRVSESASHLIHINLILQAPGIATLFEPIFNPFDETMSLFGKFGEIIATTTNSSRSFNADEYQLGWSFNFTSDVSLRGFAWVITPSLLPGATLPDTITLAANMSAAGEVRVVPEPSCVRLALVCAACTATFLQSIRLHLPN